MQIAACGLACDVCKFKETCGGGCPPGTDPRAPERQDKIKKAGFSCAILDCAIKNKVDHCLACTSFPCDVHYQADFPYSNTFLDILKGQMA